MLWWFSLNIWFFLSARSKICITLWKKIKKRQEKSDEHFEFYVIIEIQMNLGKAHSAMSLIKILKKKLNGPKVHKPRNLSFFINSNVKRIKT